MTQTQTKRQQELAAMQRQFTAHLDSDDPRYAIAACDIRATGMYRFDLANEISDPRATIFRVTQHGDGYGYHIEYKRTDRVAVFDLQEGDGFRLDVWSKYRVERIVRDDIGAMMWMCQKVDGICLSIPASRACMRMSKEKWQEERDIITFDTWRYLDQDRMRGRQAAWQAEQDRQKRIARKGVVR